MMHSAVKGFLGVGGALSLVVAGLVVFDDGADATTSEEDVAEAAPVVAEVTQTAPAQPTEQAGSTMLEQAILDAFSPSSGSKRSASNAKDFVEASINAQGYLCADAVEMRQAAPGQYGIGCVMNRDGTGSAIYLVDSRTGSVTPIS
jgi:hypothetical protein